jgi:hypothetical protein
MNVYDLFGSGRKPALTESKIEVVHEYTNEGITSPGGSDNNDSTSPIHGFGEEVVDEFAADDGGDGGEEDTLHKYARMWYNGNDQVQQQVEKILARLGWEIGEIESEEGGCFVVQAGDENGNSYIGFAPEDLSEGSLNEFAPGQGGGGGNYFQALASAWYNGTFNSKSLQKGIKSQEDVERLLQRGIICPDGVKRKFGIDYNASFDGVVISSDDYYEYADHDNTDSRTGKPFGPYDYMEFSDDELDEGVAEGLNEFAIDKNNDGDGRSKLIGSIMQLLQSGKKVDFYVPGIRGHVVGSGGNGDWLTLKRWNKPHSKINYSLPLDSSDDNRFVLKMIKPDYYQVVEKQDLNQGVAEMDGDGAGRDGSNRKRIGSYGTRDREVTGPDVHLGPDSQVTGKQFTKTAQDLLNKAYGDETAELARKAIINKKVHEARGDYKPPKEADYGDDYQDMVKRVAAQEKRKQQQPQPQKKVSEDDHIASPASRELIRVARQSNPEATSDADAINAYMSSIAKKTQDNYKKVNDILRQLDPLSNDLDQAEKEINSLERVNSQQQQLLNRLNHRLAQNTPKAQAQQQTQAAARAVTTAQGEKERQTISKDLDKQAKKSPEIHIAPKDTVDKVARAKAAQAEKDIQAIHAKDASKVAKKAITHFKADPMVARLGAANKLDPKTVSKLLDPDSDEISEDIYESRLYKMKQAGYFD